MIREPILFRPFFSLLLLLLFSPFCTYEPTSQIHPSNEKFTGNVRLLKSGKSEVQYLSSDNNPAIISKEAFEAVQIEKKRRSNVIKDENGSQRKNHKYSSKSR